MNWVCTLPPLRGRGNPFSWASVAPHPAERDACKSGGIIGRTRAGHMKQTRGHQSGALYLSRPKSNCGKKGLWCVGGGGGERTEVADSGRPEEGGEVFPIGERMEKKKSSEDGPTGHRGE